jgi:hypothetical protein
MESFKNIKLYSMKAMKNDEKLVESFEVKIKMLDWVLKIKERK